MDVGVLENCKVLFLGEIAYSNKSSENVENNNENRLKKSIFINKSIPDVKQILVFVVQTCHSLTITP